MWPYMLLLLFYYPAVFARSRRPRTQILSHSVNGKSEALQTHAISESLKVLFFRLGKSEANQTHAISESLKVLFLRLGKSEANQTHANFESVSQSIGQSVSQAVSQSMVNLRPIKRTQYRSHNSNSGAIWGHLRPCRLSLGPRGVRCLL